MDLKKIEKAVTKFFKKEFSQLDVEINIKEDDVQVSSSVNVEGIGSFGYFLYIQPDLSVSAYCVFDELEKNFEALNLCNEIRGPLWIAFIDEDNTLMLSSYFSAKSLDDLGEEIGMHMSYLAGEEFAKRLKPLVDLTQN